MTTMMMTMIQAISISVSASVTSLLIVFTAQAQSVAYPSGFTAGEVKEVFTKGDVSTKTAMSMYLIGLLDGNYQKVHCQKEIDIRKWSQYMTQLFSNLDDKLGHVPAAAIVEIDLIRHAQKCVRT
jgi:hypothetical protein